MHRQAAVLASQLNEPVPSYRTVHLMIQGMDPALVTLAHEGTKSYSDRFDLVHRREAEAPNAIWQADHSELDVFVKDGEGKPRKPWLTIVLDDYSRAVAGYMLFFGAPSTIQTALAHAPGDLAQVSAGLACLWHPPGSLHGPRQRFHLAAHRVQPNKRMKTFIGFLLTHSIDRAFTRVWTSQN